MVGDSQGKMGRFGLEGRKAIRTRKLYFPPGFIEVQLIKNCIYLRHIIGFFFFCIVQLVGL